MERERTKGPGGRGWCWYCEVCRKLRRASKVSFDEGVFLPRHGGTLRSKYCVTQLFHRHTFSVGFFLGGGS